MSRATPVTHHEKTQLSSCISVEQYKKLEQICKIEKITKSEFIRRAVEDAIAECELAGALAKGMGLR